jgi:hypothetical protein
MSTAGVGDSWGNLLWLRKAFLKWTNVKYALEDHGLVDKEIRLTKMDWTLVRAVRLQFDDQKPTDLKTDVKTLGSKGDGMSLTDSVSVTVRVDKFPFFTRIAPKCYRNTDLLQHNFAL